MLIAGSIIVGATIVALAIYLIRVRIEESNRYFWRIAEALERLQRDRMESMMNVRRFWQEDRLGMRREKDGVEAG